MGDQSDFRKGQSAAPVTLSAQLFSVYRTKVFTIMTEYDKNLSEKKKTEWKLKWMIGTAKH